MENVSIERATARKAIDMAKAIAHPERHDILKLIAATEGGRTVTNIYTDPVFRNRAGGELDQSICSQHLAYLRKCGLVTTEKQGKHIIYSVNQTVYNEAAKLLTSLADLMPLEVKKQQRRKAAA